jgi:hypothetical protein
MGNAGKRRERRLERCFEGSRLEEELWELAYEQIWPQIRRSFGRSVSERERSPLFPSVPENRSARRA